MKESGASKGQSASELISKNCRGRGLAQENPRQNAQAHQGSSLDVVEEWKWMGTPVWSHDGIICTGDPTRRSKLTFAKGASLKDPARPFLDLDGNVRRAIDIPEGGESTRPPSRRSSARRSPNGSGKSKLSKKAKS
jgi:hypothetical protein